MKSELMTDVSFKATLIFKQSDNSNLQTNLTDTNLNFAIHTMCAERGWTFEEEAQPAPLTDAVITKFKNRNMENSELVKQKEMELRLECLKVSTHVAKDEKTLLDAAKALWEFVKGS